jgi:hypothetical protein
MKIGNNALTLGGRKTRPRSHFNQDGLSARLEQVYPAYSPDYGLCLATGGPSHDVVAEDVISDLPRY